MVTRTRFSVTFIFNCLSFDSYHTSRVTNIKDITYKLTPTITALRPFLGPLLSPIQCCKTVEFYKVRKRVPRPTPNLENQGISLCPPFSRDVSGMSDPTKRQAATSVIFSVHRQVRNSFFRSPLVSCQNTLFRT